MKADKTIKALPFPVYFWTVASIAMLGLADAAYLSISHYRVYTDIGYKSFCAISRSINCDTVSQSPYSIFLNVPVPVWGVVGYAFFLLILFASCRMGRSKSSFWPTLFIVALFFSTYSVILANISIFSIHSYCIMCIVSHAISFALLFFSWLVYRRFGETSFFAGLKDDIRLFLDHRRRGVFALSSILVVVISMVLMFPAYWDISIHSMERELPRGITEDGNPWIGAEDPQLVIVEFTDYQCFQCKKMHFYLRNLAARYPDKLRLVHRHFPMDHIVNPLIKEPYHQGSWKMALLSIYAAQKDKFWKINDMLFNVDKKNGLFNIRKMAKAAGFDVYEFAASVNNPAFRHKLKTDIKDGIKLGITGTPGYLINGSIYIGNIPPEVLDKLMD